MLIRCIVLFTLPRHAAEIIPNQSMLLLVLLDKWGTFIKLYNTKYMKHNFDYSCFTSHALYNSGSQLGGQDPGQVTDIEIVLIVIIWLDNIL